MEAILSKLIGRSNGYGVYIHWPYCSKICSYCNFNKYKEPVALEQDRMQDCLIRELRYLLNHAQYPLVTSIYFGGGTPSLAPVSILKAALDNIRNVVHLSDDVEVTLEVNPVPDVLQKLPSFKNMGVNRLSIGVQSLDNNTLHTIMGRDHTASHATHVITEACHVFPGAVSIDMMFGLPRQDLVSWIDHMTSISTHSINHLSLYQLTLERGTHLYHDIKRGVFEIPSEDLIIHMYEEAIEIMRKAGLVQYEISNFAKPGFESLHNQNYWFGGNYLGIGPGAHTRFRNPLNTGEWIHSVNTLTPKQWMNAVENNEHGILMNRKIHSLERFEEVLSTIMRTKYGLQKSICDEFGVNYNTLVERIILDYPEIMDNNYLISDNDCIRASHKGFLVLDSILPIMLRALQNKNCQHH